MQSHLNMQQQPSPLVSSKAQQIDITIASVTTVTPDRELLVPVDSTHEEALNKAILPASKRTISPSTTNPTPNATNLSHSASAQTAACPSPKETSPSGRPAIAQGKNVGTPSSVTKNPLDALKAYAADRQNLADVTAESIKRMENGIKRLETKLANARKELVRQKFTLRTSFTKTNDALGLRGTTKKASFSSPTRKSMTRKERLAEFFTSLSELRNEKARRPIRPCATCQATASRERQLLINQGLALGLAKWAADHVRPCP